VQFKLPWREAGPPNHHDDKVDSGQKVVTKELYLQVKDARPMVTQATKPEFGDYQCNAALFSLSLLLSSLELSDTKSL